METGSSQGVGGGDGHAVNTPSNFFESLGTVVGAIQASHIGKQCLGRADVGGGLVSADVLLASLHSHAQSGLTVRILRDANDPARHLTRVCLRGGQETGVGTTETLPSDKPTTIS